MVGYTLLLSVIEYKTLVLRGDMEAAAEILPQIPQVCSKQAIMGMRATLILQSLAQCLLRAWPCMWYAHAHASSVAAGKKKRCVACG